MLSIKGLKRKIRSIIGKEYHVYPIIDTTRYNDLPQSFTGGSLSDSRVLWVVNDPSFDDMIERVCQEEKVGASKSLLANNVLSAGFNSNSETGVASYYHIVNVIKFSCSLDEENDGRGENIYRICNLIQNETQLLSHSEPIIKTITTLIIFDEEMKIERDALSNYIIGVARNVLIGKRIICNGVFSSIEISIADAFHAAMFMSSKYAYGMAGEVISLKP